MTDTQTEQTFWLTLANAFMAPMRPEQFYACRDYLADDLAGLCAELGLNANDDIASLRERLARFATPQDLLVDYSHLFMQPPIPATLNLSRYVDGSINGPCLDALENAYSAIGVARKDTLRDLGDHAAMQMECLAYLIGQSQDTSMPLDARSFANLCLTGALPRLANAIAAESPLSPYAVLARLAARAIEAYNSESPAPRRPTKKNRHDTSIGVWRHCDQCGKPYAREKEIQIMAKALTDAGLPADHLMVCPDCRSPVHGSLPRAMK